MDRNMLIQTTFAKIDQLVQPTSLAQIGGFRPPDTAIISYFGGHFVGRLDEDWPIYAGLPMIPLIQICVNELPYVPVQLSQIAVLTVFMAADRLPQPDALNGQGWLIRTYPSSEQLRLLPQPTVAWPIKAFPIKWHLHQDDAPTWLEASEHVDMKVYNELADATRLYADRYAYYAQTKVGGWASYIQHGGPPAHATFVFQVGTEPKAHWSWGDTGTGFFFRSIEGEWILSWECY